MDTVLRSRIRGLEILSVVVLSLAMTSGCSRESVEKVAVGIGGDVAGQKVINSIKDLRDWTPENIQKYPKEYLTFCERKVNEAIASMDASKIAINQKKAQLTAELDKQRQKLSTGTKSLEELKSKYRAASDGGSFPIKVGAFEFDQEKAKRTILRAAGEIESSKKLEGKLSGAVAKLNSTASDLQSRKDKAREQLTDIKVQMESLKIQDMTKGLADNLAGMTAALGDIVSVGVDDSDPSSTPGLDDLVAGSQVAVNEDEFSAIMAK